MPTHRLPRYSCGSSRKDLGTGLANGKSLTIRSFLASLVSFACLASLASGPTSSVRASESDETSVGASESLEASVLRTEVLALAGEWRFALDPEDRGIEEEWFRRELEDRIPLPGTTDLAGKGYALDLETLRYPVPFEYSLFPGVKPTERADERGFLARRHFYLGPAWYRRTVEVPEAWSGRHLALRLERVIWESRAWVDDRPAGASDSLVAEHRHELGILAPGPHTITLRIDNRMKWNISTIGHAYGPETQSRWNGVVGRVEILAAPALRLRGLQVYPARDRRSARLEVIVSWDGASAVEATLAGRVMRERGGGRLGTTARNLRVASGESRHSLEVSLTEAAEEWSEFHPVLHEAEASIVSGAGPAHAERVSFGFRTIERAGRRILVNGRPVFLRGTLDCCVYPLTGHPPMETEEWMRILGRTREYGFNHVRFHTWCPPEAAFQAADRLGIYLAPETPFWVDDWTLGTATKPVGLGRDPGVFEFVRRELRRMSESYGNHPSNALATIGNEFGMSATDWDAVSGLVREAKAHDPRRLVAATTARRRLEEDEFQVSHAVGDHSARGVGPPRTDWDFSAAVEATPVPLISHETGQRPVFPDYATLLPAFQGPLLPLNYERLRRGLALSGLAGRAAEYRRASAAFQLVQYKAEHEHLLLTRDLAGYQLLMLGDFTGQSEALVGIVDPFGRPKSPAAEVRTWNSPTTLLARFPRYVWTSKETFHAALEVAHHGETALDGAALTWRLAFPDGRAFAEGELPPRHLAEGGPTRIGSVDVDLARVPAPAALRLEARLGGFANSWNIWVYPPSEEGERDSGPVRLARGLGPEEGRWLEQGGRVLLLAHALANSHASRSRFDSVYWSAGWWGDRFSSLGIRHDPGHPALADFPSEGHSDWQWQELTQAGTTIALDAFGRGLEPIVEPVPDFHFNTPLAHVIEARVGPGRLLVCGFDLESRIEERHAARQFRRSLLRYAAGDRFVPRGELAWGDALELFGQPLLQRIGVASVRATSEAPGFPAGNAVDGNPNTLWHTPWGDGSPGFPHAIAIELRDAAEISGVTILPRQDGNPNGWIRECEVRTSEDGKTWGSVLPSGVLAADASEKRLAFPKPVRVRFLEVRLVSKFQPEEPFASLAEVGVW